MDEAAKKRIIEITVQMVTDKIAKGEVEDTDEALRKVTRECAAIARAAYNAAMEYLAG